jgi:hypothetical protein
MNDALKPFVPEYYEEVLIDGMLVRNVLRPSGFSYLLPWPHIVLAGTGPKFECFITWIPLSIHHPLTALCRKAVRANARSAVWVPGPVCNGRQGGFPDIL